MKFIELNRAYSKVLINLDNVTVIQPEHGLSENGDCENEIGSLIYFNDDGEPLQVKEFLDQVKEKINGI